VQQLVLISGGKEGETPEIPCCDVKKTSTGSIRTLAASLYLLNCPEPAPPPQVEPTDNQWVQPKPPEQHNYDLSHRAKDVRLLNPRSAGKNTKTKLEGCVSRGQMLVRFNEAYDSSGVPDLRSNTRTGKKHQFADNIHSQVLRGSTVPATPGGPT